MDFFNLPKQTQVNKSIPKKSFDVYINSKQKKMFVDIIDKIKWTNKISTETINLEGKEISEIQIFQVALRKKENIKVLLEIIDKSIPYHIIFVLTYENEVMLSVSQKHLHPTNVNNTVVDWTFKTEWSDNEVISYKLNLKESLDFVVKDICLQLSGKNEDADLSLNEIVEKESQIKKLEKEINLMKKKIKNQKQFNIKLELNSSLKKLKQKLAIISR